MTGETKGGEFSSRKAEGSRCKELEHVKPKKKEKKRKNKSHCTKDKRAKTGTGKI